MTDRIIKTLEFTGLNWFVPLIRLACGEDRAEQFKAVWRTSGIAIVTFLIFLAIWSLGASNINTSLGRVPGPAQVFQKAPGLFFFPFL